MARGKELRAATSTPAAMAPQVPALNMNFTHTDKFSNAIIQRAVTEIRNCPDGDKHNVLIKEAYTLGGHIAGGSIDENTAIHALKSAIDSRDCFDYKAAYVTIEKGIEKGKQEPITNVTQPKYNSTMTKPTTPAQAPQENIFLIRTMNQCLIDAKARPIPKKLFSNFWNEGEIAVLFSGTGAGKTILSVQIADAITTGKSSNGFQCEIDPQMVLYFDFELSEKQQEKRYSNNYEDHYHFSDLLKRIEIHPDAEDFSDESLYHSIEATIEATGAKILIVDNITYLKNNLETSKDALPLMKHLKRLKKKHNLSILALAHTPKRDLTRAITVNDLAGSSQISNFTDSIFTINFSAKDASLRYLKEIKTRQSEKIFDSDNVITCEIGNDHNFTALKMISFCKESEHLREVSEDQKTEIEIAIIELKRANPSKSLRAIAQELGISKNKVDRVLKALSQTGTAGTASNPYEY